MSTPVPPLPARKCEAPARMCLCGNKISAADTHQVCAACLGLQHGQTALTSPEVCEHCARFSLRSRRRRLARLASLTDDDPMLGADDLPPLESATLSQEPAGAGELGDSWGDQLDALSPISDTEDSPMGMLGATGEAELISEDDSVDLLSLGDEDGDDLFLPATQAARPSGVRSDSTATEADEAASVGLHDVCKRAAATLGVPWPEAQKETVSSRYEGKRLPKAKSSTRQLLPVFPECLEEATRSWSSPFSAKNPAQGLAALEWPDMESSGFSHLPPVEPLLASHLHSTQKSAMTPSGPAFPSKADNFQSAVTEKSYKAVASAVRALNASSLLMAYQAELEEDFSSAPNQPAVWDEMCVVTDLCLQLHRCAVQTAGRAMALLVSQERARWLNLSSLSHKEKTQLLDVPVDPKGLFGPAVATMQKRCEEKKRDGESARVLQGEIISLLNKQVIRVIPFEQSRHGFYSRYFLVPKKGGGLHPILDLRALNRYLRKYRFRMLINDALMRFVRPGDWFTSVDLTDAFLHVPIYPPHRKFLRFAFRGVAYEWLALPFGLALSPRVFIKVTKAAIAPLREKGLRLATFIDDWLVAAYSYQEAQQHTALLTEHLLLLGFRINWEKSVLCPCQITTFIGLSLNRARLSAERVKAFRACLALFRRGATVKFRVCLRLLGLMASALVVVPLGRLYMRAVQRWVASLGLNPSRHCHRPVAISAACCAALRPWKRPLFLTEGTTMGAVLHRKVVTTDASLSGWGATHEGRSINGVWDSHMQTLHINRLELMAVWLALRHFLPILRGHHVLVRTNNTTVVAYVNKQGGLRSRHMHTLAHRLILWSSTRLLSLKATHVPGVLNLGADLLSRGNPRYGDWKLHSDVSNLAQIWLRTGRAKVDLFASEENAQCPMFFSLRDQKAPLGIDALAHQWPHVLLYAFPPLELITPTLARVREQSLSLILVAPRWPGKPWLAEIIPLLHSPPWPLPPRRDLLSQANGEIFHPHPERLALWDWPVKG
ncbi:LOW QUALITY PROTEIN: uncharacterized protein LOC121695003 [Alosa sapidissima]|uniref:LOW QUALITY PROTEIN: uncharacterized protein LOC121695003 n=1 Tax=Alosa sapidissima TaxID=34773 RepID=UPI001C08839C|nr:LOW QUALITY PROTEIN: uncharacterized protein LOC121695003 [Alosa sapidissima]